MDNNINNKVLDKQDEEIKQTVAETPEDEFSAIDILISTPESIQELKGKIEQETISCNDAENRLNEAREALANAQAVLDDAERQLQKKQDRVERLKNALDNALENVPADVRTVESEKNDDEKTQQLEDDLNNGIISKKRKNSKLIVYSAIACFAIAIIIAALFALNNNDNQLKNKTEKVISKQKQDDKPNPSNDSISANTNNDSTVKKVLFDGTKPLEVIVTEHYGYHDAVFDVIEYNKQHGGFQNWREIETGTEILLPKLQQNPQRLNNNRYHRRRHHRRR